MIPTSPNSFRRQSTRGRRRQTPATPTQEDHVICIFELRGNGGRERFLCLLQLLSVLPEPDHVFARDRFDWCQGIHEQVRIRVWFRMTFVYCS